jgi:hypothetical protein
MFHSKKINFFSRNYRKTTTVINCSNASSFGKPFFIDPQRMERTQLPFVRTTFNDFMKERVLRKHTGKTLPKVIEDHYFNVENERAALASWKLGNNRPLEELEEERLNKHLDSLWKWRTFIPAPRYGITVETFLQKIGKDCAQYADKFKSWEELMSISSIKMKTEKQIPCYQRKWILYSVGKYKIGFEPVSVKFKSIGNRNKLLKRQSLLKHIEIHKKSKEERQKLLKDLKKIMLNDLTRAQKLEFREFRKEKFSQIELIEKELAKKQGILVSEFRDQKARKKEKEKKRKLREQQKLEGKLEGAKKAPNKTPSKDAKAKASTKK